MCISGVRVWGQHLSITLLFPYYQIPVLAKAIVNEWLPQHGTIYHISRLLIGIVLWWQGGGSHELLWGWEVVALSAAAAITKFSTMRGGKIEISHQWARALLCLILFGYHCHWELSESREEVEGQGQGCSHQAYNCERGEISLAGNVLICHVFPSLHLQTWCVVSARCWRHVFCHVADSATLHVG
jgi:hypothetical protein